MKIPSALPCKPGRLLLAAALMLTSALSARATYQSTVLSDSPIAYFPLDLTVDNAGTATDASGNGNSSPYYNVYPIAGPTTYVPNAGQFTGSSVESYVDLGSGANASILNFSGKVTYEAWVQPANTTEGPADIIAQGYDSTQNYNENSLRANGGNFYGGTFNFTNNAGSVNGGQQTTGWSYIVVTYDGTNWDIYQNAQLTNQSANTLGELSFNDPWAIGVGTADAGVNSSNPRWFVGNICQVALYTNALTAAQVLNHFYAAELNASPATSVPIIVGQPQSQQGFVGGSITFKSYAVSQPAITNQWFKGSTPLAGQTNATLVLNNLQFSDAATYTVVIGNSNGTTNSAAAVLTIASGNNLKWAAAPTSGSWDTNTTADWINTANSQTTVFNLGDQVLFDDSVNVATTVNVNTQVQPAGITVNSSTNNYTINGPSSISGPTGLTKDGASTLTLVNPANFTGPVLVKGGTLYAGDFSLNSASGLTVTNGATLDFGGSTYDNNQSLTISGAGVSGHGALYNSIFNPGQLYNITLAGDATIGCVSGDIWGLNAGSVVNGAHKLTVKWGGSGDYTEWNGVIFATNFADLELASGKLGIKNMGSAFGNPAGTVTVDSGAEMDFWTSDFGYSKNYHVFGVYQILASFTTLNASYTLENGSQFTGIFGGGTQTITGPFTLNGVAHLELGDGNFVFTNVLSGPGGFVWDAYNHTLFLQSSNTYSGPTVIGGGQQILALTGDASISHSSTIFFGGAPNNYTNVTIDVSGRSDQTLTLASGQTLGGIGSVKGNLTVFSGASIAPAGTNTTISITTGANPTGNLAVSGNVILGGATTLKLNGSGVNDEIIAGSSLTYGGTLNLANISGAAYAVGNSFQIFNAASYHGSFASINPATPGPGLAWDTSQLNSGFLNVIAGSNTSGPVITQPRIANGNLIFSGTGGSASTSYVVYTSTNLASNVWVPVQTNAFDTSGNFNVTNAISTSTPQLFYRIK